MEFTYLAYLNLLKDLKRNGYAFTDYETCDSQEKCVILRHDIDYSLNKAVEMAELEASQGVSSTYFVLLSSDFYNLISKDNNEKVRRIYDLGHHIGLHFDEMIYEQDLTESEVKNKVVNEVDLMQQILDMDIKSVSMHRPSKRTLESDYHFDGIVNSYGKKFFKEYKYVSDSRRRWREDVNSIITSGEYTKLHILTHAFWYNNVEENIEDSIKDFVNNANKERYEILEKNITDLNMIIQKKDVR